MTYREVVRRPVLSLVVALACTLTAGILVATVDRPGREPASAALAAAGQRQVRLDRIDTTAEWSRGRAQGARVADGRITYADARGRTRLGGRTYGVARWTSRWTSPGFSFTELIASWSARTPGSSWIEVRVRGRSATGARTSWDTLARWAATDRHVRRRSFGAQPDDGTRVAVDTWRSSGLASYRLRVVLHREVGKRKGPRVDLATVMTSRLPSSAGATSSPIRSTAVDLPVPAYSQMVHAGHFPQWGGGGEAWCSPTSVAMVLGRYGRLPGAGAQRFVAGGHPDPWVDAVARLSYDHAYRGTGNWPFSTAVAARRTGSAFVTRLRDLREAETLVRAGIPLVVSIAFASGELTGAPISASSGHLLVIRGFTASGDVIVNDPAAASNAGVRRTYRRGQLERLWLEASGGTTYVVTDAAHPLPASPGGNW